MKIVIKNNSLVKDIGLEDFDEVTKSSKPYVLKINLILVQLTLKNKVLYLECLQ